MGAGAIPGSDRRLSGRKYEELMAKKVASDERVYNVIEVIGTSKQSWEDAARNAVETASKTLRDLRIAEVVKMDMKVENGKVSEYRTRVLLSFKYEGSVGRPG
jgi:flavin-binding protein dodecin